MIHWLYLTILSRPPTLNEQSTADAYLKKARGKAGLEDLAWALLNSKEFLYRH